MRPNVAICIFWFTTLWAGFATAQERVTWVVEKFEPYYILEGNLKGQGAADYLIALLKKEMPDMKHNTEYMPILRIRDALKARERAVSIAFLKDPTLADYVQYSAATMLVPPLELTLRREQWEVQLKAAPSLSAAEVMRQGLAIGVADGRHYGDKLDKLIADRKGLSSQLYARVGNHYRGLAEMVSTKNIDATIGYSAELRYAQKLHPELSNLVSIPLIEGTGPLFAYTVIPKGEWGDKFRVRINRAITKLRGTPEYKEAMTRWFGSTSAWEAEYRNRFQTGLMDAQTVGL